jgi:hypothetical protein
MHQGCCGIELFGDEGRDLVMVVELVPQGEAHEGKNLC